MELKEYKKLKAKIFKEVKLDIQSRVEQDKENYKDKMQNSADRFNYKNFHSVSKDDSRYELDLDADIVTLRKNLKIAKLEHDSFEEDMNKIKYKKWTIWFDESKYSKHYSYYILYEPDKLTILSKQMRTLREHLQRTIFKAKKYIYCDTRILKAFEKWKITYEQLLYLHIR